MCTRNHEHKTYGAQNTASKNGKKEEQTEKKVYIKVHARPKKERGFYRTLHHNAIINDILKSK